MKSTRIYATCQPKGNAEAEEKEKKQKFISEAPSVPLAQLKGAWRERAVKARGLHPLPTDVQAEIVGYERRLLERIILDAAVVDYEAVVAVAMQC